MAVYGSDLLAKFETQLGHQFSGDYDPGNGYDHPWAYYCEAGVESTGRNCGLSVTPRGSATGAGVIAAVAGILQQGDPEHGGVIVYGPGFYYPDGHTGFWNADRGQLLGTMTDGSGVAYTSWGPWTSGYAGWYRLPGVAGPRPGFAPAEPPPNWFVQPDNPYQAEGAPEIGLGGGFLRFWQMIAVGLDPYVALGYAMVPEYTAVVTDRDGAARERTVQLFERGALVYQPEELFPWDVVMAPTDSAISPR